MLVVFEELRRVVTCNRHHDALRTVRQDDVARQLADRRRSVSEKDGGHVHFCPSKILMLDGEAGP